MKNNSYIKRYEVTITTKGPLYIGSGKTINKKEYYFNKKNKKVYLLDFSKMIKGIMDKKLDTEYKDYMLNANATMDLGGFFEKFGITEDDIEGWVDYSIDASNVYDITQNEENSFKEKGINTFIKEYGNKNYIPGSSLKGAIRTALIIDKLIRNKKDFDELSKEVINKKNRLGFINKKIETKVLNNNAMNSIRVSDSDIIDNKNMTLCCRMDKDINGNEHNLPIYYECIKPGVDIKTTITIDTSVKDYIGIDTIKRAISSYSNELFNNFTKFFKGVESYSKDTLFIGGYSGFASKTITYSLLRDEGVNFVQKVLNGSFENHEHLKDKELFNISPRMLKVGEYASNDISGIYEIGKVEIKFKSKN